MYRFRHLAALLSQNGDNGTHVELRNPAFPFVLCCLEKYMARIGT